MNSPSYDQDDPAQTQTNLTSASRRIRSSGKDASSVAGSTSSAVLTGKDPEYIPLHELAKGWKAAISWATDPHTKEEARKKNDRGNLPLHSAASFRAPVEVIGEFKCLVMCLDLCMYYVEMCCQREDVVKCSNLQKDKSQLRVVSCKRQNGQRNMPE
jgi:hypothetical protein